jgi:hypothetical protein
MKKTLILLSVILLFGRGFVLAETFNMAPSNETISVQSVEVKPVEAKPVEVKPVEVKPVQQKTSAVKFRDVPDDHWAASSVYDLVNMGVTQGYPDGTFRGNNNITRYETAMFLSKLAAAIGESSDKVDIAVEKLKDDLRADIRSLRAEIAELKRIPEEGADKPISGSFMSQIMFGNLVASNTSVEGQSAPVGPIVRYRLKTSFVRAIGSDASVKINLDTMDSGFGGGSSDLATNMLDVEGKLNLDMGLDTPVTVKVTSGPGPVVHTEEANANGDYIARSENGVVYVRPWNSLSASSTIFGLDVGLGYIARHISAFGEVEVNQVSTTISRNFAGIFFMPEFKLNLGVDYLSSKPQSNPTGPTDTKLMISTDVNFSPKVKSNFYYSTGQGESPHNAMFGFNFDLLDTWDSGTVINFSYRKVGAAYLYENAQLYEDLFAGLDMFNRYIGNGGGLGIVDVGGSLTQTITENLRLENKFDWRLSGDNSYSADFAQCSLVMESGIAWDVATDTLFEALYRVESVPSAADQSTDILQFNVTFKY